LVSEAEKSPRGQHVLTREKQHQMVLIKRRAASYIAAYADNNQQSGGVGSTFRFRRI
jgi:hypothetical protein